MVETVVVDEPQMCLFWSALNQNSIKIKFQQHSLQISVAFIITSIQLFLCVWFLWNWHFTLHSTKSSFRIWTTRPRSSTATPKCSWRASANPSTNAHNTSKNSKVSHPYRPSHSHPSVRPLLCLFGLSVFALLPLARYKTPTNIGHLWLSIPHTNICIYIFTLFLIHKISLTTRTKSRTVSTRGRRSAWNWGKRNGEQWKMVAVCWANGIQVVSAADHSYFARILRRKSGVYSRR